MNEIQYETQRKVITFGKLLPGTVFHYKGGQELYMKLEGVLEQIHNNLSVQLKNGLTYLVMYDKEVCPVPENTTIAMNVNKNCLACQ